MYIDVAITKEINTLLLPKIVMMEKQSWTNSQFPQRQASKIMGIPKSIPQNQLEDTIGNIFSRINSINKKRKKKTMICASNT